ncbi:hypothetical protein Psch_02498 [Pelotomaculum schinkii]|uniref:Uncharacterized protein n=1 Tax=Pelotomaculum schinkii TaxID=78350 RepID=A0A4Y7R9H5_9FIRM|nr:hypothetical protein Psch_02498 [Pelotomaculum schinkii]
MTSIAIAIGLGFFIIAAFIVKIAKRDIIKITCLSSYFIGN